MSHDPYGARPILPQDAQNFQDQMGSFSYAPQQFPQREIQKSYVFVDEHNRHKRLKVMRACEGCRRRKIKCDAATTNTWPCSACIRLKLHCVRPNGYDGAVDAGDYDPMDPNDQFMQMPMQQQQQMMHDPAKHGQAMYLPQGDYADANAGVSYQTVPFDHPQTQHNMQHYVSAQSTMPLMDQSYAPQGVFASPPIQPQHQQQQQPRQVQHPHQQQQQQQHGGPGPAIRRDESSPEAYSPDPYQQQDLADLLGTLKVDETGAAPYIRNKASFRREEAPALEEDDEYTSVLPPMPTGPGSKIRIPPLLMPDDEAANRYIDLYFTAVHPYVPVLNKPQFYRQWQTSRESISPLILEAMFAIGGRLAEDPGEGQQWLALASRHADAFMDIPRLSTVQGLLMILKAREAAPKRGYYYRSWMTVVHCVQMAKDLGLEEHYDDHQLGRPCESSPQDCQLRTRIWQTIFVCEVMVGTPQGRHDLAVDIDSVDFNIPRPIPGGDDAEYHVSRNFTYFSRIVRNVGKLSNVYLKLMKLKRLKEWGIEPEVQQLNHDFSSFMTELPADLSISFPSNGSPPILPSPFLGNLHGYYYLSLILCHRPQLSFLNPGTNDGQWKHHMMKCYTSAKALCRLQEANINTFGIMGLQCMQRGFSFTVYAGLSCIVLYIVAIVSPDPDLNSDSREYFARHMRLLEKVMDVWAMPELEKQIDTVREAFSADTRKAFVLKPSFPYGSPHPSTQSSPPRTVNQGYRQGSATMDRQLDTRVPQQANYVNHHSMTPPMSAGTTDGNNGVASTQPLVMMGGHSHGMQQSVPLAEAPAWNPSRIFEQWNTAFGTTSYSPMTAQTGVLSVPASTGTAEMSSIQEVQATNTNATTLSSSQQQQQQISPVQFSAPQDTSFMTPAMWQESVASVYEGGLKRGWDYDGNDMVKRQR